MSFPVTTRGPQTAADWTAANPTLDQFEVGIEINPATGAYERAKLGDGRTAWADLAYWNPSGGPKVYRALLTQTGTDAPVATVLENTLGGTVVWSRQAAGTYLMELAGGFGNSGNLYQYAGFNANIGNIYGVIHSDTSPNENTVTSYAAADLTTAADDVLTNFLLNIFVNP